MFKSVIKPSEDLKIKLLELSSIVDEFHKKKYSAYQSSIQWIRDTEEILKANNFSESAELAGVRAVLLSKEMDINCKKRAKLQNALEMVDRVQITVLEKQKSLEEKIENVRSIIRPILIATKEAGLLRYNPDLEFNTYLESLLDQFRANSQIAPAINNAQALIGKYDVLRIMAEEIEFS